MQAGYDAIIIGSGPNGLAAAITLAEADWRTLIVEGHAQSGGGMRTSELTLPGFRHDGCSAVHPLALRAKRALWSSVNRNRFPPRFSAISFRTLTSSCR